MSPKQMATLMRMLARNAQVEQLMDATGMTRPTVRAALQGLAKEHLAYICAWTRAPNNRAVAVWTLGPGPSVPRPTYTKAEKQAEYRKRRTQVMQSMVKTITTTTKK